MASETVAESLNPLGHELSSFIAEFRSFAMTMQVPRFISANTVDGLIVVDVQNAFVSGPEAVPGNILLVSTVGLLLAQARTATAPVVFLQNDGPDGAADEPFQLGWELFFPPQPGERVVRKKKDNGFDGTDLHAILTGLGIGTVAICGMLSEMCLAATARAAMEHGYGVLLPHDAHATYDAPPGPGSEGVPAAMAARAAEWSLGDEIKICASAREVGFEINTLKRYQDDQFYSRRERSRSVGSSGKFEAERGHWHRLVRRKVEHKEEHL